MSGKAGQKSEKGTEVPAQYAQDLVSRLDRRCRAARNHRELFSALAIECGGADGLSFTAAESGQPGTLCLRSGLPQRSLGGMSRDKGRKTWDKCGVKSESAPPGRVGESARIDCKNRKRWRRGRDLKPIQAQRL